MPLEKQAALDYLAEQGYVARRSYTNLENLLLAPYFKDAVESAQEGWREVIKTAVELGIPCPGMTTALTYFDSYRSACLPANLLQAQRDYFGAHTYRRVDKPGEGPFHTDWINEREA